MNVPRRVRRSMPVTPPVPLVGVRCDRRAQSSPHRLTTRIERNFSMANLLPSRPTRSARYRIGRPDEAYTPIVRAAMTGARSMRATAAPARSTTMLRGKLPALRIAGMARDEREAAERDHRELLGRPSRRASALVTCGRPAAHIASATGVAPPQAPSRRSRPRARSRTPRRSVRDPSSLRGWGARCRRRRKEVLCRGIRPV